jgi:hypothetical protein
LLAEREQPRTVVGRFDNGKTLAQLGISRDQSSDWQQMAAIPEDDFELHIAEKKAAGEPITTAGVLRMRAH